MTSFGTIRMSCHLRYRVNIPARQACHGSSRAESKTSVPARTGGATCPPQNIPQNSCPMMTGFCAMSSGTLLWSDPETALWRTCRSNRKRCDKHFILLMAGGRCFKTQVVSYKRTASFSFYSFDYIIVVLCLQLGNRFGQCRIEQDNRYPQFRRMYRAKCGRICESIRSGFFREITLRLSSVSL